MYLKIVTVFLNISSHFYISATSITTSILQFICNIWTFNLVQYFVIATF